MDQYAINNLHACVNCLGYSIDETFVKDKETNVSIRDILRHLRSESNNCEIRLELANLNVIERYLIPLLKCCDSDILFDLLIRLIMNLTQPAFICFKQQFPEDMLMRRLFIEVNTALQKYKLLFANKEVLTILADCLNNIFKKQWESRTEEEHMLIERVLILLRNVLHINTHDIGEQALDGFWSHHDKVISAMYDSGWTDILVYLSNSDDEHRFAFHTLEIISLMFKEQSAETLQLVKTIVDGSKETENNELIRLTKDFQESQINEMLSRNLRALRYDGFFELNCKSTSGLSVMYPHDLSSGKVDITRDRNLRRKPRNRRPVTETICERKSAKVVIEKLREFCQLFLENGYNILMNTARNYLVREQMQPDDETYYLWSLKFFTSVCRMGNMTPEFVSETMTHEVFHWVYEQVEQYRDLAETNKKQALAYYRKLQLAVSTYNEMLNFLLMLDRHKDKKYRELSVQIKSTVFYREEYMDMYPMLLHKFKEAVQSRALLRDLVNGSYLIVKILENHKSFNMNVVRKLKKKRKAPKKKVPKVTLEGVEEGPSMPSDNHEELLRLWDRISEVVTAAVNGQASLPDDHQLPNIYDPTLPDEREPIEPGSEPVDVQLKKALGIVQIYLRKEKPLEAVEMLRLARTMWPDEDRIALSEFEDSVQQEISMVKTLLLTQKFYTEEDLKAVELDGKDVNDEEEDEDAIDDEAEFEDNEFVEEEVLFDLNQFLLKFTEPNIVKAYGILFNDIFVNPAAMNKGLLYLMHRIAIKMKLPMVLYQLRLFRAFSNFLKNPQSQSHQFKEEKKFVVKLMQLFTKHATANRKLFVELLFSKNPRHLTNILTGEKIETVIQTQGWTDALDEELERLCDDVRVEEPLPGCDKISMIMDRFSDPTKTRRQIVGRLNVLGLIESLHDFNKKSKKRVERAWAAEEQARLIVLVDEYKDQPNAIKFIMNGMKCAVEDSNEARSRRSVVARIMELGLVQDKAQLGIKTRPRKGKANEDSEESGSESDQENAEQFVEFGARQKREPPPIKIRKIVDWTSFKMTFARLVENEKSWFVDILVDNIDSRANGIIGSLALVPLLDEESEILKSKGIQKLLGICNFLCPDDSNGENFWRIPEDMGAKELEYFRNCATSLTESELQALTMTNAEEITQSKKNVKKRMVMTESEEEEEEEETDTSSSDDNEVRIKKSVKKKVLMAESDEDEVINNGRKKVELSDDDDDTVRVRKIVKTKALMADSDDDEEEVKNDGRKRVAVSDVEEEVKNNGRKRVAVSDVEEEVKNNGRKRIAVSYVEEEVKNNGRKRIAVSYVEEEVKNNGRKRIAVSYVEEEVKNNGRKRVAVSDSDDENVKVAKEVLMAELDDEEEVIDNGRNKVTLSDDDDDVTVRETSKKKVLMSDSDEEEVINNGIKKTTENGIVVQKEFESKGGRMTMLEELEENAAEDAISERETLGVVDSEDVICEKDSYDLFQSDDDDEDLLNISLKNKRRMLDSDSDENITGPITKRKKRMIDEDSD